MQILDDKYIFAANNNILRKEIIYPSRGIIKDINNNIIVNNKPVYNLFIIPRKAKNIDINKLSLLIKVTPKYIRDKIYNSKNIDVIILIKRDIPDYIYASLQEELHNFNGCFIQRVTKRNYPYNITASHALGYVSEVENADIIKSKGYYNIGDSIGRTGIEYSHERILHGTIGTKFTIVDVFNKPQKPFQNGFYDKKTKIGETIICTINLELQKLGEKLMQNKRGSIVAINPKNGDILAFVSSPTYDPNKLTDYYNSNYNYLKSDIKKPLLIRPIQAQYPPGSLLKPVIALIGLEKGIINSGTYFNCYGKYKNGKSFVKCHKAHGTLNLVNSMTYSCNNWYCQLLSYLLDNNNIQESYNDFKEYLESFGLGIKTNIEIPFEKTGSIKSSEYYNSIYGKK
ncbi:MAG: penicillin-binding protein 2, partial [Bacteroides sp.]